MKIFNLTHIILAFFAVTITIAAGSEITDLDPSVMSGSGGKLFCVQPEKTYCLNVVNYPRDRLEILFEGLEVDNSDA